MKALVIDDSRAMRRILTRIVEKLGMTVTEASNGEEGIDQLRKLDGAEVVLVDWNMPVMTGIEFVKRIRQDEKLGRQKIIMVTTETEPKQMARALLAGVDEYVMKPFDSGILVEKLRLIGVSTDSGNSTSAQGE